MNMNRTIKIITVLSLCALSWSARAQGVGLWAPGAILGPTNAATMSSSAIRSNSAIAIVPGSQSSSVLPRTVLTATGRYLITTDPTTGYVNSIIEVSRTRE
jgi:hypothetical protein